MNSTVLRNTSMAAPFSASSVYAIAAVVIVSFRSRWTDHISTLSGTTTVAPPGPAAAARQLATDYYSLCKLPRTEGSTPLPETSKVEQHIPSRHAHRREYWACLEDLLRDGPES